MQLKRFGTELNPSGFATQSLIGIKRKPCEVSQIPNGTSLNSDIEEPSVSSESKSEDRKC